MAGLDGPRRHREILGGLGVFGDALDFVELDSERVGHELHGLGEHRGAIRGHRLQRRVVDGHIEAHGPLGVGGVVKGGVGGLGDDDLVDPVAGRRRHDGEQFGEARADT